MIRFGRSMAAAVVLIAMLGGSAQASAPERWSGGGDFEFVFQECDDFAVVKDLPYV